MEHEPDTESRHQMIRKQLSEIVAAAWQPLDDHTSRVWFSILDEQSKGFKMMTNNGLVYLTHTCGPVVAMETFPTGLGLNQLLVRMFEHLLDCPNFP